MDRVSFNLFFSVFCFVCVAWLLPGTALAQEAQTYNRFVHADREEGVVLIRAGADASFARFADTAQRILRSEQQIIPEDIIDANPGRIIFVCRSDDGAREISRNPALHDRCHPGARSWWLVRGLTYRVPIFRPPNQEERVEPQVELQRLGERVIAQQGVIRDLRQELRERASEPEVASAERPETVDRLPAADRTERSTEETSSGPEWRDFVSLLIAFTLIALVIVIARRRIAQDRARAYADLMKQKAAVERWWRGYVGTLRKRYRRVIGDREQKLATSQSALRASDARCQILNEELEETRHLLREKSAALDTQESEIGQSGTDFVDQMNEPENEAATDGPTRESHDENVQPSEESGNAFSELIDLSQPTDESRIRELHAEVLTLREMLEHKESLTKRIPELMNEIDALKPSELDKLYEQLNLFWYMKREALRAARERTPTGEPDRLELLEISLCYDRLIETTNAEIRTFEQSDEGKHCRELQEELNAKFMEATGLYGYTATMEATIERDRRKIDRLHLEALTQLRTTGMLIKHLREELQRLAKEGLPTDEIERRPKRDDEPTLEMRPGKKEAATPTAEELRIHELELQVATLSGRALGQEKRLRELEERQKEHEIAADARARTLQAQIHELRTELAESQAREAELQIKNESYEQLKRSVKQAADLPSPNRQVRRRRTQLWSAGQAESSEEASSPLLDKMKVLAFSDALVKFMDVFDRHVEQGHLLPLDRACVIDLARLIGGSTVENPFLSGDFIPAYTLPYYLALQCDGKLPKRIRSQTNPPPGPVH